MSDAKIRAKMGADLRLVANIFHAVSRCRKHRG